MSARSDPPPVWERRHELARWIDGSEGLVVGLDFDGTLAPIAADHTEPVAGAASRGAVRDLAAHPRVLVAVVSGRGLDDLVGRVDLDGVVYAGNHGLELRVGDATVVHREAAECRRAVRRLADELARDVGSVPGCTVERKGLTATVHFRRAPDHAVDGVVSHVEDAVSSATDDVRVVPGKRVREIRPTVDWDKGDAMEVVAGAGPPGWRSMYVGDDTTDEDAFRAVRSGGVGVRVGNALPDDTAATHRARSRARVPELLGWLTDYAAVRWDADRAAAPAGSTGATGPRRLDDLRDDLRDGPFRPRDERPE